MLSFFFPCTSPTWDVYLVIEALLIEHLSLTFVRKTRVRLTNICKCFSFVYDHKDLKSFNDNIIIGTIAINHFSSTIFNFHLVYILYIHHRLLIIFHLTNATLLLVLR